MKSLQRLLETINKAHYPDGARLIISVDGGASRDVLEFANAFRFMGGDVEVVPHGSHLGLRNHIIWCGDLSNEFGSVIVLEDDLIVDPQYYMYAVAALNHYGSHNEISGISLYSQRYNHYTNLPFEPSKNGKSTYFMQVGCSLGQAWTSAQWSEFRGWYDSVNESAILDCIDLPEAVKRWPETSWKKYYNTFLIKKKKIVVYPYDSYTSNCSDYPGEHVRGDTNRFQVPIRSLNRSNDLIDFTEPGVNDIRYDAFMEPGWSAFYNRLGVRSEDITVDLHGQKPIELIRSKSYVITCRDIDSTPIKTYPMRFRPVELNLEFEPTPGSYLHLRLYKLKSDSVVKPLTAQDYFELARYYSYYDLGNKNHLKGYLIQYFKNVRFNLRKKLF